MRLRFIFLLIVTIFAVDGAVRAQVTPNTDIGMPASGTFAGSSFDLVQLENGNLHFEIHLWSIPGRGKLNVVAKLVYDSLGWSIQSFQPPCPPPGQHCPPKTYSVRFSGGGGFRLVTSPIDVVPSYTNVVPTPQCSGQPWPATTNYRVREIDGTNHAMAPTKWVGINCTDPTLRGYAADGSGWVINVHPSSGPSDPNAGIITSVYNADGSYFPNSSGNPTSLVYEDSNGNEIVKPTGVNPPPPTDTLGRSLPGTFGQYVDSSGTTQNIQFTYTSVSLATSLCKFSPSPANCTETTNTVSEPQTIALPDGRTYTFTYVQGAYGTPASVTLPDGGQISWTYGLPISPEGPLVASRTETSNGSSGTWTYTPTVAGSLPTEYLTKMTVQDPVNNKMVFTENLAPINLTSTGSNIKQYYDSSGNLLQTVQTDFNAAVSPLEWAPDLNNQLRVVDGYLPIRVTTTLNPSNQVKKVETDWDSVSVTQGNGTVTTISIQNPLETREYDFGSGSPGPLLRRTTDTYLHQNNSTYLAKNLLSLKSSEIIHDGSGKLVAQTLYTYDSTPLISTTGAPNHDYTNYSTSNTVRGNLTQVQRWRNTDGAWLSTTYTYDDLGNLRSMTDPCGNTTCSDMSGANHTTTYSYSDNWANSSCVPSSTNTYGYLTLTTDPLGHRLQKGYFPCTGLTHQMQDENDLKASRSGLLTSYDYMGRTTEIDYPDGGQTKFAYSGSSLPYTVTTTRKINSTQSLISQTINDGLGRAVETQLTSDPQGTVYTDTTYDTLGRVSSLSNPYRKGSDITSTPGITTYGYDGLGRKVTEIYPDGSVLTTAYCGASTLVTDPTKRWRRSRVDGLGRLVEVDEPNAIGASVASTGCPGTGEPIWVTSYTLDALGNLTNVVQNGSHQRSFTYDSLSKLLTSSNPEVGTITYTYDADGNTATKKDARNIITTYGYDVLNREISRSYSNGDPTVSIAYDQAACLGLSSCDNVGHRTSGADAAGSELWSYQIDTNHQQSIHKEQRTTSGISKITTYVLDLAGNTTQVTYPTFQIVNYTFDSANRPSAVQDASNGITYATGPKTSPGGTCANNVTCYTPQGTVYAVSIGQTASFAGLDITNSYSYRLQPNEFKASSVGGNAIDITYSFVDPATLKNAGHVYSITNNLNSSRTQSFTYDQVNRILSAGTSATTGTYCWGYQYSYDAWGNLTSQAGWTPNYTGCTQTVWPGAPADGNNHLSNFGYDFSGNTTGDGYYTYAWNAESQVKTAGGVTYTYDGDGRRASKVGSKLYWYDARSEILGETDASGNTLNEYIFFGAKRIAMLPAGGTVQYYVEDSLGSSRIVSTNTGVVCYDADFSPYGGERQVIDSCTQNNYKFEGKERDTETGNDDFGARYYTWRFGRWLSADWSTVPIAVPYANLTNPQTLNLYAMVADDPVSFADLEGHQQAEPPDVEPERDENEERPDIEPWNRAGAAIAERAAMERELAQAEFEANHPNGYDNPLTGICYAPRVVPREKEGEVYVTDPQQKSGKPYVGRTTQGTDTRMKTRTDGRTGKAEVVDTYKTAEEGQYKEQKAMDNRGGKANLDNRRREVNSQRMKELEKKYAPSKPKLPLSEPFIPPTPPKFPEDDF